MNSRHPKSSKRPIQARSMANKERRSLELIRLKGIAIAALVAACVTMSGCQQMGFRSRNDELKQMIDEQDDWALPLSANNRVPRPNVGEIMAQRRSDAAKRRAIESGKNADNGTSDKSVVSKDEQKIAGDESESNLAKTSSIPSTPYQDLDIEGALESLPPGMRDILRKQLDVAQRQAKAGPRESRTLSDNSRDAIDTTKAIDATSTTESQLANRDTPKEKASGKVSRKMSDTNPDEPVTLVANTPKPDPNENFVTNALAVSQTTSNQIDPSGTQVLKASSTSPVHIATPSPQSQSASQIAPPAYNVAPPTSPSSWRQSLNQTIEQLEKQIKEIPSGDEDLRMSQEVTLRMLYLSQRRLNDATREIDFLSEQEQDYFRHQMHALYEASNPDARPSRTRHWSLVMNSQREATNQLAAISNLEVKSAAFCTQVEGYGVITKFPKYQFKADEELLLYCEIENVAASKVKEGFESQLQGSYEITDSKGNKVADQLLPIESEICQNHRRDYFIVYKIFMPQQILPGNYQLSLTVEDTKARKFGQSNLAFQIKK